MKGNPLAIELAAVWVKLLSCREIDRELHKNLDFLAADRTNLPVRHRTFRAVFNHSWDLLNPDERMCFRKLAVLQSPFDRLSAQKITGASMTTLASLVDKSILQKTPDNRLEMHELLRQYASEQLASIPGEQDLIRSRHAAREFLYCSLAIRRSHGDFWGIAMSKHMLGHIEEQVSRYDAAVKHYRESLHARRRLNADFGGMIYCLIGLGRIDRREGNLTGALHHFQEALILARKTADVVRTIDVQCLIGSTSREAGDDQQARTSYGDALELSGKYRLNQQVGAIMEILTELE